MSCGFLDRLFCFFTALGDGGFIWFVTGGALICTKKYRKGGVVMLCAMALGFITGNLIFKNLIARPRPCWINEDIVLLIKNPADYSFPSGHTLSSVICCTVLMRIKRTLGAFYLPIAVLIAFSRLYLYLHFPTDVLFSIAYGIFVGNITWHFSKITPSHILLGHSEERR